MLSAIDAFAEQEEKEEDSRLMSPVMLVNVCLGLHALHRPRVHQQGIFRELLVTSRFIRFSFHISVRRCSAVVLPLVPICILPTSTALSCFTGRCSPRFSCLPTMLDVNYSRLRIPGRCPMRRKRSDTSCRLETGYIPLFCLPVSLE